MGLFDGDEPKRTKVHELGEPLDGLSIADLDERIGALRAEIQRLEADKRAKEQTKDAASAAFKPTIS